MKSLNRTQSKILTLVSLICLLIPSSILGLWIYVFDLPLTYAERVTVFKKYFPDFLGGRWGTTLLSMIFCVSAIVFAGMSLKLSDKLWKVLNTVIVIISSFLLFLNLWSMM